MNNSIYVFVCKHGPFNIELIMRRVQWGRGQDFLAQRKGFFVFFMRRARTNISYATLNFRCC